MDQQGKLLPQNAKNLVWGKKSFEAGNEIFGKVSFWIWRFANEMRSHSSCELNSFNISILIGTFITISGPGCSNEKVQKFEMTLPTIFHHPRKSKNHVKILRIKDVNYQDLRKRR